MLLPPVFVFGKMSNLTSVLLLPLLLMMLMMMLISEPMLAIRRFKKCVAKPLCPPVGPQMRVRSRGWRECL